MLFRSLANDIINVGSLVYSGGLAGELARSGGKQFIINAFKLAPRLAASGAGQNIITQLAQGKKLNEIDYNDVLGAATAYTALGIGIPGITKIGGKIISKTFIPTAEAAKVEQALPVDKNAPITVRTIPEKGALRAQGYTNVKVEFTPKPGQVTPTIPGRAIAETAPKAPKGQEAIYAEARKYATPEKFANAKINVYHGTSKDFINFDVKKIGRAHV